MQAALVSVEHRGNFFDERLCCGQLLAAGHALRLAVLRLACSAASQTLREYLLARTHRARPRRCKQDAPPQPAGLPARSPASCGSPGPS